MFAGFEVLGFNRLLRGCNAAGDQAGLDGDAFFHAQALQQLRHPFLGEDAHQVVLEGQVETGGSWIALASGSAAKLVVDAARLVALRAEDVQAADSGYFVMLLVGLDLVAIKDFGPVIGGDNVLVAGVVPHRALSFVYINLNFSLRGAQRLGDSLLDAFLLGHKLGIAAEQDVGSAAGHVGSDRDHAFSSSLGYDFGFALVVLGVEHDVLDIFLFQELRKTLRFFDGSSTNQHRTAGGMQGLDFGRGCIVFFLFRAINNVGILQTQHRPVSRNDHHFQAIDLVELRCFGFRRAGHAGQLFVHAEIVLEGDGGESLVLTLDLYVFLGFNRLVQAIRPAASGHQATGKLVHDNDFAVFHHILDIALVKRMGLYRSVDVVLQVPIFWVGDVSDAQKLFDFFPASVGHGDAAVFFIHHKIAGELLRLPGSGIDLFPSFQLGDDLVDAGVLVGRLFAGA